MLLDLISQVEFFPILITKYFDDVCIAFKYTFHYRLYLIYRIYRKVLSHLLSYNLDHFMTYDIFIEREGENKATLKIIYTISLSFIKFLWYIYPTEKQES